MNNKRHGYNDEQSDVYGCKRELQDMAPTHYACRDSGDNTIDRDGRGTQVNKLRAGEVTKRRIYHYYYSSGRDWPSNGCAKKQCVDFRECGSLCSSVVESVGSERLATSLTARVALRLGNVSDRCRFGVVMLLSVFVLLASLTGASCARTGEPLYIDDSVQNYLTNFGYLPPSNSEAGNLRSEVQLRDAIRHLQRFGNIPVTGKIDEKTQELLRKPRCGIPDQPHPSTPERRRRRFVQQGAVWNHTDLTWSLQKKPQNLDTGRVRAELHRALSVWSDNSKLTFKEISSDKADIVISFVKRYHDDSFPFDGRGQILAHAFFPGLGRGGDAHFDDEEIWLLQDSNDEEEGTSLFAVAAHEFGHSLGLSHSSVQGALMYPWYQGLPANFVLPDDDRLGIQNLYGAKEDKVWAKIPVYPPVETPRVHTTERPDRRPERPRWPSQDPDKYPTYPRHRPTHPPRYPERPEIRPTPPERKPEYPERRPYYPDRRTDYNPPKYPERRPVHTTPRTEAPRRPETEHPDRRTHKYYPDVKNNYPDRHPYNPYYPHHPHTTTHKPHHVHPTDSSHPKPEQPRKPHSPKKPYYPPEKPWHRPDRRHSTESTPTVENKPPKPDSCNTNYDAIALIRGEVFIFKSQYFWRIGTEGIIEGYPTFISRMWSGLPDDLTHVDAVYERPDRKIVFFIGKKFYVFNGNELERSYPRPLTDLGLPETLEHLNAAMVWGHNGKTYFYNETMYWKFDEDLGTVELDYPRDMSMWKGVGYDIDTVFQWKDGKTYFFKGKGFWKFNDLHMQVEDEKQKLSGPFWMGCPYPGRDDLSNKQPYQGLPPSPTSTFEYSKAHSLTTNILLLVATTIFFILSLDLT